MRSDSAHRAATDGAAGPTLVDAYKRRYTTPTIHETDKTGDIGRDRGTRIRGRTMATFLQLVIAGVALGCAYALVALGFSMIYKATEVINFAQGEFLLLGAFLVADFEFLYQWNFFVALLAALAITVLVAVVFDRFVLRRMIGRPVFSILMITIGLQILLQQFVLLGF